MVRGRTRFTNHLHYEQGDLFRPGKLYYEHKGIKLFSIPAKISPQPSPVTSVFERVANSFRLIFNIGPLQANPLPPIRATSDVDQSMISVIPKVDALARQLHISPDSVHLAVDDGELEAMIELHGHLEGIFSEHEDLSEADKKRIREIVCGAERNHLALARVSSEEASSAFHLLIKYKDHDEEDLITLMTIMLRFHFSGHEVEKILKTSNRAVAKHFLTYIREKNYDKSWTPFLTEAIANGEAERVFKMIPMLNKEGIDRGLKVYKYLKQILTLDELEAFFKLESVELVDVHNAILEQLLIPKKLNLNQLEYLAKMFDTFGIPEDHLIIEQLKNKLIEHNIPANLPTEVAEKLHCQAKLLSDQMPKVQLLKLLRRKAEHFLIVSQFVSSENVATFSMMIDYQSIDALVELAGMGKLKAFLEVTTSYLAVDRTNLNRSNHVIRLLCAVRVDFMVNHLDFLADVGFQKGYGYLKLAQDWGLKIETKPTVEAFETALLDDLEGSDNKKEKVASILYYTDHLGPQSQVVKKAYESAFEVYKNEGKLNKFFQKPTLTYLYHYYVPSFEVSPPPETIAGVTVALSPRELLATAEKFAVTREELPQDVSLSVWKNLKEEIRVYLNEHDIDLSTYSSVLESHFLDGLLSLSEGEVTTSAAQFYDVLHYLLEIKESDREGVLAHLAQIQNCSAGQKEGLSLVHHALDSKYKSQRTKHLEGDPAFIESELFISRVLQQALSAAFSDKSVIQKMTGREAFGQLVHQSLFLKNLIGRAVGLHHTIDRDEYPGLVLPELYLMEPKEAAERFLKEVTPARIIQELQKTFKMEDIMKYNTFLETRLGEGFDPYAFWGENFELSDERARDLLIAAGFLGKV